MMKTLKIIGIIMLCIVVLIVILSVYISGMSAITKDYIKKTETGGDIEAEYLSDGTYEVSYYEEAAMQTFEISCIRTREVISVNNKHQYKSRNTHQTIQPPVMDHTITAAFLSVWLLSDPVSDTLPFGWFL